MKKEGKREREKTLKYGLRWFVMVARWFSTLLVRTLSDTNHSPDGGGCSLRAKADTLSPFKANSAVFQQFATCHFPRLFSALLCMLGFALLNSLAGVSLPRWILISLGINTNNNLGSNSKAVSFSVLFYFSLWSGRKELTYSVLTTISKGTRQHYFSFSRSKSKKN